MRPDTEGHVCTGTDKSDQWLRVEHLMFARQETATVAGRLHIASLV